MTAARVERQVHPGSAGEPPLETYAVTNRRGSSVTITNLGGIVLSLRVPDAAGQLDDVVLGHPTLERYRLDNLPYFGAVVGRCANRIARGELRIDGVGHALTCNDGPHHLHGGRHGFDRVVWSGEPFAAADRAGVALRCRSPDGEEGYPGNLAVEVRYALTDEDELLFEAEATTDRPTACNLVHHGHFDLEGGAPEGILGHLLEIAAGRFTPVGPGLIPTGELRAVEGTPFDFRRPTAIGARLGSGDEQLALGRGYDHNFALDRAGEGLALAARLIGPKRGRVLEVRTTEPGLQLYTGNFFDGTIAGKRGRPYPRHAGVCLEPQRFPDAPHHPAFPSVVLRPGQTYRTRTAYRFTALDLDGVAGRA
jgi:aldose 1-epimerase